MFTFIVIAVGVIVIWRIVAAAHSQSAFAARFGPSHAPPTHTHDSGSSHLPPHLNPLHPAGPYSVAGSDAVPGDAPSASGGGAWAGVGGFDSSPAGGGFDSSSTGGGSDGGGGGGDFGGGGGGGGWS